MRLHLTLVFICPRLLVGTNTHNLTALPPRNYLLTQKLYQTFLSRHNLCNKINGFQVTNNGFGIHSVINYLHLGTEHLHHPTYSVSTVHSLLPTAPGSHTGLSSCIYLTFLSIEWYKISSFVSGFFHLTLGFQGSFTSKYFIPWCWSTQACQASILALSCISSLSPVSFLCMLNISLYV